MIAAADPPGAALLDAAAVMDRLRSPGGCPWDAEQTHQSLLPYLIEECYELYQAVEDGDRAAVREELGDVLLQVLFHARVAAEGDPRFDIDDVAEDLVAKLVGRHPHVFAPSGVDTADRINTAERQQHRWDELKRAEKQRESSVDGVPSGQPAVALAAKLVSRTARAGLPVELLPAGRGWASSCSRWPRWPSWPGSTRRPSCAPRPSRFAGDVRAAERAAAAGRSTRTSSTPRRGPSTGPAIRTSPTAECSTSISCCGTRSSPAQPTVPSR